MLAVPAALVLCLVGLFTDRPRRWALVGLVPSLLLLIAAAIVLLRSPASGDAMAERTQALCQDYLQNEGHARRGTRFEQLALCLDTTRRLNEKLTEAEVLALLGPPDLVAGDESVKEFVYYYDRYATKDWVLYVTIEKGGAHFGYNAADVNDHTGYRKYEPPSAPQPQPASDGKTAPPAVPREQE